MSCKQTFPVRAAAALLGLMSVAIRANGGAATPNSKCVEPDTSGDGVVGAAAECSQLCVPTISIDSGRL